MSGARLDRGRGGGNLLQVNTPGPQPEKQAAPKTEPLPEVSSELLAYLEKRFPNRLPHDDGVTDHRALLNRAWGVQDVMNHLRNIRQQLEEDPTSHVHLRGQQETGSN